MANYSQITPNKMINLFTHLYSKEEYLEQPTKMLWGQPGIGKSQAVKQFSKKLEKVTGKTVNVTIASLLLMSPIDLRGIPTKDENDAGEMIAKWLTPEIFKMNPDDKVINILFLDEISAAPPSVQASAYQICLDKRVGEHLLPKNCIVIAAGNRVTDKSVAYKMPKALGNRLTHFEMVATVDDWKQWAYKKGIDTRIIGFINHDHKYLNKFDPDSDDVAFPTPRSWEMVDTYLKCANANEETMGSVFDCIAGSVGAGTAHEFKTYLKVYNDLPSFEDISTGNLKTCSATLAKRADVMFALSTMIASRCSEEASKIKLSNKKQTEMFDMRLENVLTFVQTIPANEYKTLTLKDIFKGISQEWAAHIAVLPAMQPLLSSIGNIIAG